MRPLPERAYALDQGRHMTAVIPLGRFDQKPLRDAWPNEASNFTPWLAEPENLKLLGQALELGELQNEQIEIRVGDFRIDILASDSEGNPVIVENQLERTDHTHLGQLLTYLASHEGKATLVWIAEDFRDEHRAVIDWLNRNTSEDFAFFAVVIELWSISGSPPAPRFRVVAGPNDWTKNIRAATREVADPELAERHRIRIAYWRSFGEYLRARKSAFGIRRPVKNPEYRFRPERPGFRIFVGISIRHQAATVGLAITRDPDRSRFRTLLAQQPAIQSEFGESLIWDENLGTKRSFISVSRPSFNPAETTQYPDAHVWMLDRMERFRSVFGPRIAALPANGEQDVDDTDQ